MWSNSKTTPNKKLKLLPAYDYASGSRIKMIPERKLESLNFHIHKFTNRVKPTDNRKILLVPSFYEFGVETIGICFCLPQIIHANPDCYVIVVGWYGRQFLYSKIADEYWELDEDHQWLREYSDAFRNDSRNISKFEIKLSQFGRVVTGSSMAQLCVQYFCTECKNYFVSHNHIDTKCDKCSSTNLVKPLFGDLGVSKKRFVSTPKPSEGKKEQAKLIMRENSVAIFARNRKRYGRNLSIEFYKSLINLLKSMGYNPIWMGEKQSVYPCPDDSIVDFTNRQEARDLEFTLAILSQCKFTIQFYTASTRLASMVKTPWILFESADQLVGHGQEGMRVILTTDYDKKKIVIANFFKLTNDEDQGIKVAKEAIQEITSGNFETKIAMIDNPDMVRMNTEKLDYWWRKV